MNKNSGIKIRGGWLTLNRACNNRCEWCYARGTDFKKDDNMPKELANALIKIFSDLKVKSLILIGGEPTLYKEIFDVIKEIRSKSIKPIIISNGIKFADLNFAERIKDAGLDDVTISIKAGTEEKYGKLTGNKKGFAKMLKGADNLQKLNFNLNISITIVKDILHDLPKMISLVKIMGIKNLSIDLGSPILVEKDAFDIGIPSPLQLADAIKEMYNNLKNSELNYGFYVTIPLCILDQNIKKELIESKRIMTTCHVNKGSGLVFTQNGSIIPCNHFTSHKLGQYGNDFTNARELKKFWGSKEIKSFRHICQNYPHEKCIKCEEWQICGGGCLVKWMHWNPKNYII